MGVTRVGDVANTAAPLPVSSVSAAERLAEENEPSEVALPTDVIAPVRLALVTTVAANEPVPLPVTPPVRVMVWSPVFVPLDVPLIELVPVTARVGVALPDSTTEFTELGVIAPRVRLIAGVVVEVATVPDTPLAVLTETDVTVPPASATKLTFVPSLCRFLPLAPA